MNPNETLPDSDYRFQMRFEKRPVADFYRPTDCHTEVIEERKHWLSTAPDTHLALLPEGVELLRETVNLAAELATLPETASLENFEGKSAEEQCRLLGESWEADFLLMKPDDQGVFRLYGGCLCFPSHWDLHEKLGKPLAEIHGPVPGLNEQLGRQIDGFLKRIKPGFSWERVNWGLSRSPELNLHPSRSIARLDEMVTLDEVWWRVEEQSLVALPETGGILFGIRLVIKPFAEVKDDPEANRRMTRALETMPEPMAEYKGIAQSRRRLLELLQS
jgi:hypothetical protein